jgi:uncharacterized protein YndB with AHSA1/START domain
MSHAFACDTDAELDLVFERHSTLPPEKIWAAWTTPSLITQWFTPAPWKTIDCRVDLRPGGEFFSMMQSPEGQSFPNRGCYLVVEPHSKLVWTSAMVAGFRPADLPEGGMAITVELSFTPDGQGGTHYKARAFHKDKAAQQQHAAMGYEVGWGKAFEQLEALMRQR